MTIFSVIAVILLWSIIISVAGFVLALVVGLFVLGWSACHALINRLRFGTWAKPAKGGSL